MNSAGAIFTWGYQGSTTNDLLVVCNLLRISTVVDCRRKPVSRVPGFGGKQLRELFGARPNPSYVQRGDVLGGISGSMKVSADGPPPVDAAALATLRAEAEGGARLLLICAAHAPGDCHRHITIALPLARAGVSVRHVFEGEIIEALELQRAIDSDDDAEYECTLLEDELAGKTDIR